MRVILIENPEAFDEFAKPDMHRWWSYRCITHHREGEVFVALANRSPRWLKESIKRLASFGVKARVVNREV